MLDDTLGMEFKEKQAESVKTERRMYVAGLRNGNNKNHTRIIRNKSHNNSKGPDGIGHCGSFLKLWQSILNGELQRERKFSSHLWLGRNIL